MWKDVLPREVRPAVGDLLDVPDLSLLDRTQCVIRALTDVDDRLGCQQVRSSGHMAHDRAHHMRLPGGPALELDAPLPLTSKRRTTSSSVVTAHALVPHDLDASAVMPPSRG